MPAYDLLAAAARGVIEVDQRLLRALLDEPGRKLPDILRFAFEDHAGDGIDLSIDLMRIFCAHPLPESVPFFIAEIRRFPDDVPDEVVEAFTRIGAPVLEPLLELYAELDEEARSEIPFLLAALGIPDGRIDAILASIAAEDPDEEKFLREVYEDSQESDASVEPYDLYRDYPESADPALNHMSEWERLEFLASPHSHHRRLVAESWVDEELSDKVAARLLETAQSDTDEEVRSFCWEALIDRVGNNRFVTLMRARLADPAAGLIERIGLATALLDAEPDQLVHKTILDAYGHPPIRARAMRAMVRSFSRDYVPQMLTHLDDADVEIRRQAVVGVGLLGMTAEAPRLEELFLDPDLRADALMAYALAAPGQTSRYEMRRLYDRMEHLASGFTEEDRSAVSAGIDLRLRMHGKPTLFLPMEPDEEESEPVASSKVGRNDPCPCGSGKKYKKCCGA